MKIKKTANVVLIMLFCFLSSNAYAQGAKSLIVLDCSTTMNRESGSEKIIYIAKREVMKFVGSMKSDSQVGVMVFGHSSERCDDAELLVSIGSPDAEKVRTAISPIETLGSRGLIYAIESAIKVVGEDGTHGTVYVITSGVDQCGDRDYAAIDAFEQYGKSIRVVIIGVDVDERDADTLKELASSLNGSYTDVALPQQLNKVLDEIAQSTHSNLVVTMSGADYETPNGTLRIYDSNMKLIHTTSISGLFSTELETGTYNIELQYSGRHYWQRQLFVEEGGQSQVSFKLDEAMGEMKFSIVDIDYDRIKGSIKIFDDMDSVVFEGTNQDEYIVSLPEGYYRAEVTTGDQIEYYDNLEIVPDETTDFTASMSISSARVEIVVNNYEGIPVNASISIEDINGNIVGESQFTSTYSLILPPGDYIAMVHTSSGAEESVQFYLPEGDSITVPVDVEVPMGSILVYLVDTTGNEVFGRIKVYDSSGKEIPHFEWESIDDSQFGFDVPAGSYRVQAMVGAVVRTMDSVSVGEYDETVIEIVFPEDAE